VTDSLLWKKLLTHGHLNQLIHTLTCCPPFARKSLAASPVTWTTRHIPSHQDLDPTALLDFWALQNLQMDNLAKVFWMQHSHFYPVSYPLVDKGFQVWLGDCKLSSHPTLVFFDHIHGSTILDWHVSHQCFPACYAQHINWDVCATALTRLPTGRRR
jgi:hypothetical protein